MADLIPGAENDPIDPVYGQTEATIPGMSIDHSLITPEEPISPEEEEVIQPDELVDQIENWRNEAETLFMNAGQDVQERSYGLLLAREIREQMVVLRRRFQEIHDGTVLAIEQVQDKRLDWVEKGPQATIADVFLEVALVFFMNSPALKSLLGRAFKFAADSKKALAIRKRSQIVDRLTKIEGKVRSEYAPIEQDLSKLTREISAKRRNVQLLENSLHTARHKHGIRQQQARLLTEITDLNNQYKALRMKGDRVFLKWKKATAGRESAEKQASSEQLSKFFKGLNEDYVVAGLKAAKTGHDKAQGSRAPLISVSQGLDTIGVALLRNAQDLLRDMEQYLNEVEAIVDFLLSTTQATSDLTKVQAGFYMLWEIRGVLAVLDQKSRTQDEGNNYPDLKTGIAREIERTIWAYLISDKYETVAPTDLDMYSPGAIIDMFKMLFEAPPDDVVDYLRERFYDGDPVKSEPMIFDDLRDRKAQFNSALNKYREGGGSAITLLAPLDFK